MAIDTANMPCIIQPFISLRGNGYTAIRLSVPIPQPRKGCRACLKVLFRSDIVLQSVKIDRRRLCFCKVSLIFQKPIILICPSCNYICTRRRHKHYSVCNSNSLSQYNLLNHNDTTVYKPKTTLKKSPTVCGQIVWIHKSPMRLWYSTSTIPISF